MAKMKDKILTCRDCDRAFTFTITEQEDFAQKGFASVPGRCPTCRVAHKAARSEPRQVLSTPGSGGRSAAGYVGATRETFPAVCARCGKETRVPFQPQADRPVYCAECYSTQPKSGQPVRRPGVGSRRQ